MKSIFSFFLICLLFIAFTYANKTFLRSDVFRINEISIEGDVSLFSSELKEESDFLKGQYIWDIDTEKITEILKKDVRVEDVKIEKKIPNKVRINIRGKRPAYYILYKNNIYVLDKDKVPFSYFDEFSIRDFPILSIKNIAEIEELTKILERVKGKQLEKIISQLYVEDENCIAIVLLDGTILKTRTNVLEEKYDLAERLYLKLKTDGVSLKYIDIRFADYIVK